VVTPYYSDDHVTIYHGDCREIVPRLDALLAFDVVVTDPPYGINLDTDYSSLSGTTSHYNPVHADNEPFDPSFLLDFGAPCTLFGADHYHHRLPSGGTWHVWDKRVSAKSNMFADLETWWTSFPSGPSRILRYQWVCGVHPGVKTERIQHPTVKPVDVMRHVVAQAPPGVILDPFMGSGTTLRAAKDLGRKAVGIEIDERYCEIAAKRMAQEVLPL
jgi:DNA modification methylase